MTAVVISTVLALGNAGRTNPLHAQQEAPPADSVRAELARLSALVDSLRAEVARLQAAGQEEEAGDALAQLRAAAQAAAAAGGGGQAQETPQDQQQFVGRQRSLQALNPEISLTGDVFAQVIKDNTDQNNFFPREFELSIVSNLDPFSRAKAFISRHQPGGEVVPFDDGGHEEEGGELAVEEGYVEWVSLPGGLGLKLGHFYQQFGQLNRWHAHAYPFQSRSLPSLAFIGEEPLGQTGVSARWLLPVGGDAGTYTLTGEVTRSENENLFGISNRPSTLANLNGFWVLSPSVDVDLSASWVNGSYEDDTNLFDRNLYGVEMSFTWRPPSRSRYRGLNVRAGAMVLDGLVAEDGTHVNDRAKGIYTMAENRLSTSWLVGARFDWTENPHDPDQTAWLVSPTLTWWQSEFVRIRGEYDGLGRGDVREGRFLLQVTFAMGPHKHETY
jgi:hypothetical protein